MGVARALDNKGNRGFDILRSDGPGMPWQSRLRVNYFGGFTITSNGEIWVGDEGGGVYRSTDKGESFAAVDAPRSVSCLASAGNDVWACTPALPAAPALSVLDIAATKFVPSISMAEVDTQVMCAQQNQTSNPCQAAWIEWQRDVIGRDPSLIDTGSPVVPPQDAGPPPSAPDAAVVEAPAPQPAAGCSVLPDASKGSSQPWLCAAVLFAVYARRRATR